MAFSRLYVTWQRECLLHCEHGCWIDTTQLMQLITVWCLVMREVSSAAVWVVILCLCKSVLMALSVVFLSLCYQYMFVWPPAVDGVTEHRQQTTNDTIPLCTTVSANSLSANLWFSTAREVHALQMLIIFVCCFVYNESTAVTEKCVVVYRTQWI